MHAATPNVALPPAERRIYGNRTLNLRAIRAIGYDMDYTLVHYHVEEWERCAYEHLRRRLELQGWPVADLTFDPDLVARGLVIDLELGHIVKANRFGYVKRAQHGTDPLDYEEQRKAYARTSVAGDEPRWAYMDTLFALSDRCMYAQLVRPFEEGRIPGVRTHAELYRYLRKHMDEAHREGELKAEILSHPERFVALDEEIPLALLDQKRAGKKLLLITNSEWEYTSTIMTYAFDRFLPEGMGWRALFDVVIVSARKPGFFGEDRPIYRVDEATGLLAHHVAELASGNVYSGGDAATVEVELGLSGEQILYVGDHIRGDVYGSKSALRWRTALVIRELEDEIAALRAFEPRRRKLAALMTEKRELELAHDTLRLALQRSRGGYGPQPTATDEELNRALQELRTRLAGLDAEIGPLAQQASELVSPRWGGLLRAGNDKSHFARQMEGYADIYMSRVSNFLAYSPFTYLRSARGTLPHDEALAAGA